MERMKRLLTAHRYFLLFYGALFAWFLGPYVLLQKSFVLGDYALQFFPWSLQYASHVRAGTLPYWIDEMACGFPLVAEGQVGPYYLLHRAAYFLLPFEAAYTWMVPLHFFLGGVGFYVYARKIGLSEIAAAFSSLLFSFSSLYGGCFYNTATLKTLTWLPWALWLLEAVTENRKPALVWVLLLGILQSQMWAAGFSQLAIYAFLYMGLHVLFSGGPALRVGVRYAAAVLIGIVLASPQIDATAELARHSMRWGGDAGQALWGSMHPLAATSFLFPRWGAALQTVAFLGTLPLVFIALSLFSPKTPRERTHGLLALVFFLLAIGKYNPVYYGFIHATGWTLFRNPTKFLFFAQFSMALLAGFGLQKLLKPRGLPGRMPEKVGAALCGLIVLLPAAASGFLSATRPFFENWGMRYAEKVHAMKTDAVHPLGHYREKVRYAFEYLQSAFAPGDPWNVYAAGMAVVALMLLFGYRARILAKRKFQALAFLALCCDLAILAPTFGSGFMGNSAPNPLRQGTPAPIARALSLAQESGARVAEAAAGRAVLEPNANLLYGVPHAGGYTPLLLRRYYELTKELGIADASFGRRSFDEKVWKKEAALLNALSVGVVVSEGALDSLPYRKEAMPEGHRIYVNPNAVPPFFIRHSWKILPDKDQRLAYLKSERFDPSRETVLEAPAPAPPSAHGRDPDDRVFIREKSGLHTRLRTESAEPGVLVSGRAFYPRWKAKVDGVERPLFAANHALTGLWLEPGTHEVEFFWDPSRSRALETVSSVCMVVCALTVLYLLSRRNPFFRWRNRRGRRIISHAA